MSHLFSPISFRSVEAKNRIAVAPMCQYSSEDGFSNDWHLVHYGTRAAGGAGIIITEATAVSAEGRISFADLGIWKDEHIAGLKRINAFITQHGSVPGIQLAHAGRKASKNEPWNGGKHLNESEGGWQTVAPSALPFADHEPKPIALDKAGIKKVISDFGQAAARSVEAGFKIFEIHAAHGYLMHQFLSPLSNKRDDEYGGTFENRIRLLLEVVDSVQANIPENLPIFVRISATDWVDDELSWDLEQSIKLSAILKKKGVDLIDVSSGGLSTKQKIKAGFGYQVDFANQIKQQAGIATGAVGMITNAQQAETILRTGQADLILMARELLRNPYFPLKAAHELRADIKWPAQYERAPF